MAHLPFCSTLNWVHPAHVNILSASEMCRGGLRDILKKPRVKHDSQYLNAFSLGLFFMTRKL